MSALAALHAAVYARLSSDLALAALVGTRIYDGEALQETALPYVVIGESTETRVGVQGGKGWSDTVMVHAWSKYGGRKEAVQILGAIEGALSGPITLDGHTGAYLRYEFAQTLIEDDGLRHVPMRFRAFTFQVA